jgi:hypothetical protein
MEKLFLKPAKTGSIVRDPRTMIPLSQDGEWKPRDSYWLRRLHFADAIETTPPSATAGTEGTET